MRFGGFQFAVRPKAGRMLAEHALLSLCFALTRVALKLAGLGLYFSLDWMFLADPRDLRERLLETVFYFHSFPPGMNLLTALLLELSPDQPAWLAAGLLHLSGLVLINSLFYLCRAGGLSSTAAFGLSLVFCLIPQALYFENLYLYAQPIAALLCLSCALFLHASRRPSSMRWLLFFVVCSVIGWLRSTFHLGWFVLMLALAVVWHQRYARSILLSALAPGLLLAALYVKNLAVFGVFASSSYFGSNLTQPTVARMPDSLRRSWVDQGKLSPYANLSVFSPTKNYLEFFPSARGSGGPPALERIERASGAANFNHRLFLEVNRRRLADARVYLRAFPFEYLNTVLESMIQTFAPSADWHPIKGRDNPHYEHRKLLGGYERLYEGAVHRLFASPVGLYALLPLPIFFALRRALLLRRSRVAAIRAQGHTALLCAIQIGFVVGLSSLVTRGEASRYRYEVEALIWLLAALGVLAWAKRRRRRRRAERRRRGSDRAVLLPERAREGRALQDHGQGYQRRCNWRRQQERNAHGRNQRHENTGSEERTLGLASARENPGPEHEGVMPEPGDHHPATEHLSPQQEHAQREREQRIDRRVVTCAELALAAEATGGPAVEAVESDHGQRYQHEHPGRNQQTAEQQATGQRQTQRGDGIGEPKTALRRPARAQPVQEPGERRGAHHAEQRR
jgi:hypothetical protein